MDNIIREYIGHEDQLMTVLKGELTEGAQRGTRFIQIMNGGNLNVIILPDNGMDIYQVRYKGINMNYISPAGIRSFLSYDSSGNQFLRNFFVGQLTTVGLQNAGPARIVYGDNQGLHGRINNIPAEEVSVQRITDSDTPYILISGVLREARIFGENLRLKRTIKIYYQDDKIMLHDEVINRGYEERQFALMYHINFGYPLIDESSEINIDTADVQPRTKNAADNINSWNRLEKPSVPYEERCYFHDVSPDADGYASYRVMNKNRHIAAKIIYEKEKLPYFCQWKMMGRGEYVLGMEPANIQLDGPALGENGCVAPFLKPGEKMCFSIEFQYETC